MIDSFLSTVMPILAVFWMVVGGIIFAFIGVISVGRRIFRWPVKAAGTDKPANPKQLMRTEVLIAGWGLAFAAAGSWLHWGEDDELKGQFLIVTHTLGAIITLAILWRAFRR